MRASSWLLVVSVAVTALKVAGKSACSCNGVVNSDGRGGQNCQSTYQGKKFCYVDQGKCRDQKRGTSSSRYWSYEACRSTSLADAGHAACICNGFVNSKGQGNCQTSYKGKKFCYVEEGGCLDQSWSTSYSRYWSYEACTSYDTGKSECHGLSGEKCEFPFKWDGRTFNKCTTYKSENGAAWCATRVQGPEREAVRGKLEDCSATCGVGTSPTTTSAPVYQLSERGQIECSDKTDCPPPFIPSAQSLPSGLTVTELQVEEYYCGKEDLGPRSWAPGPGPQVLGDYEEYKDRDYGDYSDYGDYGKVCQERKTNYCSHKVTENHPECKRCRQAGWVGNNCRQQPLESAGGSTPTILSTVSSVSTLALDHLRPSPHCIAGLCRCRGRCRTKCCRLQAGGWGRNKFPVCPRTC